MKQILREEEDMARWLENRLPMTVQQYLGGTANWRTDLYSGPSSGTPETPTK